MAKANSIPQSPSRLRAVEAEGGRAPPGADTCRPGAASPPGIGQQLGLQPPPAPSSCSFSEHWPGRGVQPVTRVQLLQDTRTSGATGKRLVWVSVHAHGSAVPAGSSCSSSHALHPPPWPMPALCTHSSSIRQGTSLSETADYPPQLLSRPLLFIRILGLWLTPD